MDRSKITGYESLSAGYLFVAFAVSILLAWYLADWWLLIPIFLIEAGAYYFILGIIVRPGEQQLRQERRDAPYFIFWGGTLVLVGAIWLLNREYPGNVPLLIALFIIWIGVVAMVLSLGRFRRVPQAPQQ